MNTGDGGPIRRIAVDRSFQLAAVLDGTQDFRWHRWKDGWHSGVLDGNLIHIRQVGGRLEYRSGTDLDALLRSYFRLDDDINAVLSELSARDEKIATLVKKHPHLRVLRQPDPWECMVAYICSATNSVGRIRATVESVAERLGNPQELDGESRKSFPTYNMVLEAGVEPLARLDSLVKTRFEEVPAL